MGLQKKASTFVNAKLCEKSVETISAQIEKEAASTFPECKNNLRRKETICNSTIFSPTLEQKRKEIHSKSVWKISVLGRAVDSTLLCPISAIASKSAAPTEDTMQNTVQLLDYLATQEEAVLTYNASDMKLAVHSDAS